MAPIVIRVWLLNSHHTGLHEQLHYNGNVIYTVTGWEQCPATYFLFTNSNQTDDILCMCFSRWKQFGLAPSLFPLFSSSPASYWYTLSRRTVESIGYRFVIIFSSYNSIGIHLFRRRNDHHGYRSVGLFAYIWGWLFLDECHLLLSLSFQKSLKYFLEIWSALRC